MKNRTAGEREALEAVARALDERRSLALTVRGMTARPTRMA
jgi:hypothetical protein